MGAVSRTLEILLADWEISFNTQVKNRACVPCMAEQTGVHDVIFHAEAQKYVSDHALELILPILMPPRACAVHARHTHARRWHRMGDTCIPEFCVSAEERPNAKRFTRRSAARPSCPPSALSLRAPPTRAGYPGRGCPPLQACLAARKLPAHASSC